MSKNGSGGDNSGGGLGVQETVRRAGMYCGWLC